MDGMNVEKCVTQVEECHRCCLTCLQGQAFFQAASRSEEASQTTCGSAAAAADADAADSGI